jgi:hypothetical protein
LEKENGNIDLKRTTTDHILKHSGRTWNLATLRLLLHLLDMDGKPKENKVLLMFLHPLDVGEKTKQIEVP